MNIHRSALGTPGFSRNSRRRQPVYAVLEGQPTLGDGNAADIVQQVAPYVKAALKDDAVEDVETLKARIENHRRIRNRFPRGSAPYILYDNKINVLEAKLRAAKIARKEEKEDRQSKWEWASLGKTSVIVGLVVGAALTGFLINAAGAQKRIHRQPPVPKRFRRVA